MRIRTAAPLALALSLCACGGRDDDRVIARVGSFDITESYLTRKAGEIAPGMPAEYLASGPGRRQFLDIVIQEKLILDAARKSDVSGSRAYKDQVGRMEEELKSRLEDYKNYLLTKMWVDELREKELKVSDAEVQDHHARYPYRVTLDHILTQSYEDADAAIRRVKAGADFAKVAREVSSDRENVRLQPVMYGEFIPELEEMAFKMRVGEVQGVVKSRLGYHILRKAAQENTKFTEVQERVRKLLEKKKFDAYLDKFKSKVKVEVLDETYK